MHRQDNVRMDRRSFLKVAAGTGLAAACGFAALPSLEAASEVTLERVCYDSQAVAEEVAVSGLPGEFAEKLVAAA